MANPLVETPHTWIGVVDAARYAGVSEGRIEKACKDGLLPGRSDGRRRLVPLELVLLRLAPRDLESFRRNLERAAALTDAPVVAKEWCSLLSDMLAPVLDELEDARRRAALAEAQLEQLRGS